jgi:hypothetical protein
MPGLGDKQGGWDWMAVVVGGVLPAIPNCPARPSRCDTKAGGCLLTSGTLRETWPVLPDGAPPLQASPVQPCSECSAGVPCRDIAWLSIAC